MFGFTRSPVTPEADQFESSKRNTWRGPVLW
jgi:hypothetical protein